MTTTHPITYAGDYGMPGGFSASTQPVRSPYTAPTQNYYANYSYGGGSTGYPAGNSASNPYGVTSVRNYAPPGTVGIYNPMAGGYTRAPQTPDERWNYQIASGIDPQTGVRGRFAPPNATLDPGQIQAGQRASANLVPGWLPPTNYNVTRPSASPTSPPQGITFQTPDNRYWAGSPTTGYYAQYAPTPKPTLDMAGKPRTPNFVGGLPTFDNLNWDVFTNPDRFFAAFYGNPAVNY